LVNVIVKNDEPFENALRRFKKKWLKAETLRELHPHTQYLTPRVASKLAAEANINSRF
jgi:small subunit ribosomal protein S21